MAFGTSVEYANLPGCLVGADSIPRDQLRYRDPRGEAFGAQPPGHQPRLWTGGWCPRTGWGLASITGFV